MTIKERNKNNKLMIFLVYIVSVLLAIFLTIQVFSINFVEQTSLYVLPVLIFFVIVAVFSITKFIQLSSTKKQNIQKLKSDLNTILILGSISFFVGIFGYFKVFYATASTTTYSGFFGVITMIVKSDNELFFTGINRAVQLNTLVMVSFYTAILTSLIWYILHLQLNNLK
jgi:hypothetical protein